MTDKEAILRDLKIIAILEDKIDYSDHENIGAVLKLNPKSLFSTEYGDRYLSRIRDMYDGREYDHSCILCGEPLDGDGPICSNCYKMITIGNAKKPDMPEQETSAETQPEIEASQQTSSPEAEKDQAAEIPASREQTESERVEPEDSELTPDDRLPDKEGSVDETDSENKTPTPEQIIAEEEEREKAKDGIEDDTADLQRAYDEMEQDAMDPKARRLYIWRAIIMLFVVACFAVAIVCGLVLMIRRAGGATNTYYNKQIEKQVDNEYAELRC